ncbi:MAG: hypothetical protein EOO09_02700 [Chitinophagaceae bacterium]|nr:MAG: hypothetical protein EOO09_02700 [Chitinophagaceae bacterium]
MNPDRRTVRILAVLLVLVAGTGQSMAQSCDTASAYYYSVNGKYPMSSANLLAETNRFLGTVQPAKGSGYITLRFTINCRGKMENGIEVLQVDSNYAKTSFDKSLVDKLQLFLRTLDKWNVGTFENGTPLAYRGFLSFKINDGKVVNIIP